MLLFIYVSCFRYIYWKGHESQDGIYDFDGNLDIEAYFAEASKVGLYVILRLGPYIDAEVDMVRIIKKSSYGTCDEVGRAKSSYGMKSSKIQRINRLL